MTAEPWEIAIRGFILAVFGLTTGLCFGQTLWRRGLRRVALFAYASAGAALSYGQLSLLFMPLTDRTWPVLGAACVQVVYWAVLFFGGVDDEPEARDWATVDPATRDLIRRHPQLLAEFERYRHPPNVAGSNNAYLEPNSEDSP